MAENQEHIDSIILRKLEGTCTEADQALLSAWLAADTENKKYFQDYENIYRSSASRSNISDLDVNEEWTIFKASINKGRKGIDRSNYSWLRLAASIVLISVLGYLIWISAFQSDTITVYASNSTKAVLLPDSSIVTLNYNTSLTYSKEFGEDERNVSMIGEAFFEVTRDEHRPFIISMQQSTVEVLGTSFNIKASEEEDEVVVIVNSGKVSFKETVGNTGVILKKGEKGILMKKEYLISKTSNLDTNFMAWKTREIVFDNVSLNLVIQTINKIYDSDINIVTEVGEDCKVTVTFENQSLQSVLLVLEQTLNLEYRINGDIIEVIKADC